MMASIAASVRDAIEETKGAGRSGRFRGRVGGKKFVALETKARTGESRSITGSQSSPGKILES
jgi:hypothetical protein